MKKLEEWLYKDIYKMIKYNWVFLNNYLSWDVTKEIESVQRHWIDNKFKILFWNKNLSDDEKNAIIEMFNHYMETFTSSILRLFESDLYEIEWYNPWIDLDGYSEKNPEWKGSLIKVSDLKWETITDNSMYENFIEYIEEEKNKS